MATGKPPGSGSADRLRGLRKHVQKTTKSQDDTLRRYLGEDTCPCPQHKKYRTSPRRTMFGEGRSVAHEGHIWCQEPYGSLVCGCPNLTFQSSWCLKISAVRVATTAPTNFRGRSIDRSRSTAAQWAHIFISYNEIRRRLEAKITVVESKGPQRISRLKERRPKTDVRGPDCQLRRRHA